MRDHRFTSVFEHMFFLSLNLLIGTEYKHWRHYQVDAWEYTDPLFGYQN